MLVLDRPRQILESCPGGSRDGNWTGDSQIELFSIPIITGQLASRGFVGSYLCAHSCRCCYSRWICGVSGLVACVPHVLSFNFSPEAAFPAIKESPDDSFLSWDLSEMFFNELPENPFAWSPCSENPPPHGHSNSNSILGSNNSESYSNSDCANRADPLMDQHKRRRMISNRESARRSRMRKQKHLEDLTSEVDRLKFENAQLSNRLQSAECYCQRMSSGNKYLRIKNSILRENLRNMIPFQLSQHLQLPPLP